MIRQIIEMVFGAGKDDLLASATQNEHFKMGDLGNPKDCTKKNEDCPYLECHQKFMFQLRSWQIYDFSEVSAEEIYFLCKKIVERLFESILCYHNNHYYIRELYEARKILNSNDQIRKSMNKVLYKAQFVYKYAPQQDINAFMVIDTFMRGDHIEEEYNRIMT